MATNVDDKIMTLDSEDCQWLDLIIKAKLYRHQSQNVKCSLDEIEALRGEQKYFRELDTIFGLPETAPNDPNFVRVDEFVVKIIVSGDSLGMDADFVEAKKREVYGVQQRNS